VKIIGIDPALKTGWAVLESGQEVLYGTWYIDLDNPERDLAKRLIEMTEHVRSTLDAEAPDLVVYEQVQFVRSMSQVSLSAMWRGIIVLQCAIRGIRCEGVPVGTLKKWATGDGKASKQDMAQAAMGLMMCAGAIMSSDEADAICLAHYGEEVLK
jgi:Holliday junction resolvasome RuvABC endonuclease subunit